MVKGIEVEHNIDKEKEEGSLKTEVEKIEAIRSLESISIFGSVGLLWR